MISDGLWYYQHDDAAVGPVDLRTLRAALDALDPQQVLVREGEAGTWLPPREISGLLGPFVGPADPDWPNSPTKVFLYLALGIAAFEIDVRYGTSVALPAAITALVFATLRSFGLEVAHAVPVSFVLGPALAFAVAYATAAMRRFDAAPAYELISDVLLPLVLAGVYLSGRIVAFWLLLALEAVALAIYAFVVATGGNVRLLVPLTIHAVAVSGLARLALRGRIAPPPLDIVRRADT